MAAGCLSRTAAASASFAEAWNSPSAWMIFARRSRSVSACRAIAHCMVSGMSTCLTSTFVTLTPYSRATSRSRQNCWALTRFGLIRSI